MTYDGHEIPSGGLSGDAPRPVYDPLTLLMGDWALLDPPIQRIA